MMGGYHFVQHTFFLQTECKSVTNMDVGQLCLWKFHIQMFQHGLVLSAFAIEL